MNALLPWIAGALCLLSAVLALFRRPLTGSGGCFVVGMLLLGGERLWGLAIGEAGLGLEAAVRGAMVLGSLTGAAWLGFSLTYARGNAGEFLRRWKWLLAAALLVPLGLVLGFGDRLLALRPEGERISLRYLWAGKLWLMAELLVVLGVLTNLEKTFRTAVGMARWRVKYVFLGAGVIFGVKLYVLSQALLFSGGSPLRGTLENVAVIVGCGLMAVAHFRSSFGKLDLYPSTSVLKGSLTVLLAGAYFLIVGLLAQVVSLLGGASSLPAQSFLVLLGIVGLAVLLLSDRFRSGLQRFVSRHFRRPEHDFRKLWSEFTQRSSSLLDAQELAKQASEVVAENFRVLGVSLFQGEPEGDALERLHTTDRESKAECRVPLPGDLPEPGRPFNLERASGAWAEALREACPRRFEHGGERLVVPLQAAERLVGLMVLCDRVNGVPYSEEEFDLLKCLGDQLAAGLLNCSLTEAVLQAKELEAFQTLSTFFVHDLKNAANSLNLMLQNLPVHFDDPEFREDAVRAVGSSVERINQMILKLGSLRQELQLRAVPCSLQELCEEVLGRLAPEFVNGQRLERELDDLPPLPLDREAMASVLTNLVVNAREAIGDEGSVEVRLAMEGQRPLLRISDDGAGMSEDFVRRELFRPFHSTKSKGLGIGMFQCKKIVEAHGGEIRVASSPGAGTTIDLRFPPTPQDSLK